MSSSPERLPLAIPDALDGLKAALKNVLSGSTWQRCRPHFMGNLANRISHSRILDQWSTIARSIFEQSDFDAT